MAQTVRFSASFFFGDMNRTATTPTTHRARGASNGRASSGRSPGSPALRALGLGAGAGRTPLQRFGESPRARKPDSQGNGSRGPRLVGGPCKASGRRFGRTANTRNVHSPRARTVCRAHRALATRAMIPRRSRAVSFWTCQGERAAFRLATNRSGSPKKASPPRGRGLTGTNSGGLYRAGMAVPKRVLVERPVRSLGICARKKTGRSICQCSHPINPGDAVAVVETW